MKSPVHHAMKNGGVETLDARGLMPLDAARARVRAHTAFRKGAATFVGGTAVLESDRLWAALLSLEDADELVREATRLAWFFHPRERGNVDLFLRFGEGILPWLETFLGADGRLVNVPWCVVPCLNELGGAALFEKLWAVRSVFDVAVFPGPGPFAADSPGDVDRLGLTPHAAPEEPDESANALVISWIWSKPAARFPLIAKKAATGDPRAALMLRSLAQVTPSEIFGYVGAALGAEEAARIFAASGAPTTLDETAILTVLDAASGARGDWPVFFEGNEGLAYLAMRLVAYRQRGGDGWMIVLERAGGSTVDDARTLPFVYGTALGPGWIEDAADELSIFEDLEDDAEAPLGLDLDGVTVVGPHGPMALTNDDHAGLDLRAAWMTDAGVGEPRFTVLVRAYLTRFPDAGYRAPVDLGKELGLAADEWDVIVVTRTMHHVIGKNAPEAPYDDAALRVRPSSVASYQSLARAIVGRDASLFTPGEDNLDFRAHAKIAAAVAS